MRVVVTRPQGEGARTAEVLRARGHDVLLAPLMRIEPIASDLSGTWGGVVVTSANALAAIANHGEAEALRALPVYTVGRRSAQAAQGFADVHSADGDAQALVRLIAREHHGGTLLYLAGEDRAVDLPGDLSRLGIATELRIVYRAVAMPFPPPLIEALQARKVDAVLHYSRRSAEHFILGADAACVLPAALALRHLCLSSRVAEPLVHAGASGIMVAPHPDEAALIGLLDS